MVGWNRVPNYCSFIDSEKVMMKTQFILKKQLENFGI